MPAYRSGRLWAVVMAGGSGTRFWPESREKNPKQFLSLFGKKTLFEETLHRISPLIPKSRVVVVTQKSYTSIVKKLGKLSSSQILGEPVGRNTAPCVALAAQMILKKDPQAVLAILPSDHKIGKPALFCKVLAAAEETARETGMPVTFGIQPDFPHTGYGYLEIAKLLEKRKGLPVFRLKRFHEKPTLAKARVFLKTRRFLWNSGMFIWSAGPLLQAARQFLPKVYKIATVIARSPASGGTTKQSAFTTGLLRPSGARNDRMAKFYPQMPSISIDYGLMEPMRGKILTLPADIEWCDLGGWRAFQNIWPRDREGNGVQGKQVLISEGRGNFVRSGKRLTALLGVSDLVVVDTEDALLIASRDKVESVRNIVGMLRKRRWKKYL